MYARGSSISLSDPLGLDPAVTVTLPDGTKYVPVTYVKNSAQAAKLGVKVGTLVPIAVPPSVCPQNAVEYWRAAGPALDFYTRWSDFGHYWAPNGPHDFKIINPMYDAYGNFEFGATGVAAGFFPSTLQAIADAIHGAHNNPINTQDIASGIHAIQAGGTLGTFDYPGPR